MGPYSKVAAGAASIQFQCIICFDDFDLADRMPMVLPCGHTYVCHACTRRLDRCMECRQPLFLSVPSTAFAKAAPSGLLPATATGGGGESRNRRLGNHEHPHFSSNHPPPHSFARIPLSIPKNVVLVSLMEAAQRQMLELKHQDRGRQESYDEGSKYPGGGKGDSPRGMDVVVAVVVDDEDDDDSFTGSTCDHEEDDNDELELDRTMSGMTAFSASCGTYAVTADGVVVVQPNNPRASPSRMKLPGRETLGVNLPTASIRPTSSDDKKTDELVVAEMPTIRTGGIEGDLAEDSAESPLSRTPTTDSTGALGDNHQQRHNDDRPAPREPFVLRKGQTVQVVSLENRVAKLARNTGYIVLGSSSHLVKGTPNNRRATGVVTCFDTN
jgi:Zinc finger, C3HC4 type (RING finger)